MQASGDGVARCARYALPTAELRYCGPGEAPAALRLRVAGGADGDVAERALARFEALHPYLDCIARETGRAAFDPDVVDAYWLGNDLLLRDWRAAYAQLLDRLARSGLPRAAADRLAAKLPPDAAPSHAFHVLFVGVGNVTGHVETTIPNMDACRVSWGIVADATRGTLDVLRRPLTLARGEFALGDAARVTLQRDLALVPDAAPGDAVAIHWSVPVERLDPERFAALESHSERAMRAASRALT